MEYSIGKVSRLLGLSIEGIRNYEKSGIISSRREEESNYRKYRYLDITSLVRARMYRSFGFSISETAAMTNDFEIPEIQEAFLHREASLKEEAGLLSAKAEYLQHMYHELGAVENRLGKKSFGLCLSGNNVENRVGAYPQSQNQSVCSIFEFITAERISR